MIYISCSTKVFVVKRSIISLRVSRKSRHVRPFSDTRSLTLPVRDLSRAARRFRLPRHRVAVVSERFLLADSGRFPNKTPRRSLHENDWSVVCPNDFFSSHRQVPLRRGHRSSKTRQIGLRRSKFKIASFCIIILLCFDLMSDNILTMLNIENSFYLFHYATTK